MLRNVVSLVLMLACVTPTLADIRGPGQQARYDELYDKLVQHSVGAINPNPDNKKTYEELTEHFEEAYTNFSGWSSADVQSYLDLLESINNLEREGDGRYEEYFLYDEVVTPVLNVVNAPTAQDAVEYLLNKYQNAFTFGVGDANIAYGQATLKKDDAQSCQTYCLYLLEQMQETDPETVTFEYIEEQRDILDAALDEFENSNDEFLAEVQTAYAVITTIDGIPVRLSTKCGVGKPLLEGIYDDLINDGWENP